MFNGSHLAKTFYNFYTGANLKGFFGRLRAIRSDENHPICLQQWFLGKHLRHGGGWQQSWRKTQKVSTFWTPKVLSDSRMFSDSKNEFDFHFLAVFLSRDYTHANNNFNAKSFQDAQWWHQSGINSFVPIDPNVCCIYDIYDLLSAYFSQI